MCNASWTGMEITEGRLGHTMGIAKTMKKPTKKPGRAKPKRCNRMSGKSNVRSFVSRSGQKAAMSVDNAHMRACLTIL